MFWPRPIPLVGDATSSRERATDPHAWAFPPEVRAAFYEVVRSRRDVRRYRPDPVDGATLERVLGAAHAAPSVGHSQPWRFVLVSDPAVRMLGTSLNEDGTRLYDRDRGLLRIRGNDELIDAAREKAEDRVLDVARDNGILEKAQDNAEDSIRGLATSLGYQRVVFR